MELKSPKLDGNKLSFDVSVLEGDLTGAEGAAALFIDRFAAHINGPHGGHVNVVGGRPAWHGAWYARPGAAFGAGVAVGAIGAAAAAPYPYYAPRLRLLPLSALLLGTAPDQRQAVPVGRACSGPNVVVNSCLRMERARARSTRARSLSERHDGSHIQNPDRKPLVALTGATGFIGQHLLKALSERGYRLRVLLRRPTILPEGCASVLIGDLSRPI